MNHSSPRRASLRSRFFDLVVGTNPALRSRVSYGLVPMLNYIVWCAVHVYSAHVGYMSMAGARFMIVHNLIGALTFYPLVRSGYTARFKDSGLILPQIIWGASSTIICYALNAPLRAALLQMLCFIHLFGLFTLRERQLELIATTTISMLFIMFAVMAQLDPTHFNIGQELFQVLFASLTIGLLTRVSILHARARGKVSRQKKELADAVNQVADMVTRDTLTGLFNRVHMQDLLRNEVIRQGRTGKAFCVAMIDLDHFKLINDQHGHHVGDDVLRSFARDAALALRETDTIGRWGGEEFMVLMRETALPADAVLAVERIRERTDASHPSALLPALRFSFSAGVTKHVDGQTIEATVGNADGAMYAAKHAGRGCTVIGNSATGPEPEKSP